MELFVGPVEAGSPQCRTASPFQVRLHTRKEVRDMIPIAMVAPESESKPSARAVEFLRDERKKPRKASEKDSELEHLLRSAVRLLNAQKRAERIKAAESKGNRKVR